MAVTALTLITQAYQDIGILGVGTPTPTPYQQQVAFVRLNQMIDGWATQMLTIPFVSRSVFPTVAGKGGDPPSSPYTIGVGGDFDTARPVYLQGAGLLLNNAQPYPVELPRALLTSDAYQAIQVKGLQSTLFTNVYYRPTYTGGLGEILLWPIPDNSDNSVVLYNSQQVGQFADLTTEYDFPPGYQEAMQSNLAIRLAGSNGVSQADVPTVFMMARESLATMKRANVRLMDLPQDPAVTLQQRTGYNIQTGTGGGSN